MCFFLSVSNCTSGAKHVMVCSAVNGTEFSRCGGNQDRYFRIVSDEGSRDTSQLSGKVEICYDPEPGGSQSRDWYRVCGDSNWNDNTAAVVCQHLGFSETGRRIIFVGQHTIYRYSMPNSTFQ